MEELPSALVPLAILGAFALTALVAFLILHRKPKKDPKEPELTLDAKDLLHDLTKRGAAVVRVELINPDHLYLRRPQ